MDYEPRDKIEEERTVSLALVLNYMKIPEEKWLKSREIQNYLGLSYGRVKAILRDLKDCNAVEKKVGISKGHPVVVYRKIPVTLKFNGREVYGYLKKEK